MLYDLVDRLKTVQESQKDELGIVLKLAPVLKACKQAAMFFVSDKELSLVKKGLINSSLKMVTLYKTEGKRLIFIYRESELESCLSRCEHRLYLERCSYCGNCFLEYLPKLREVLKAYYDKTDTFPHEIGIFLGYPLCDIEGYVRNSGNSYLFSGYWKIYDNLHQTLLKFADFDRAKQEAVNEWFEGKKLFEMAC